MTQSDSDLLIRLETLSLLIGTCDHACAVTVRDAITTITTQAEQLQQEREDRAKLEEALEWYAGSQNWSALDGDWAVVSSQVRLDQGKRARAALARTVQVQADPPAFQGSFDDGGPA